MSFADSYLSKKLFCPTTINEPPAEDLNIVVIIPCINEPLLTDTVKDLINCDDTILPIEIIIHVNSSEKSEKEILDQNERTVSTLSSLFISKATSKRRFHVIHNKQLPAKHAGAGLARKIAMDEAVNRFNIANKPDGIIVSLDADTRIEKNYLSEIERFYKDKPKAIGANIQFSHPIDGDTFDEEIYEAITKYELYLRYYRQSLKHTGYPWALHTIGSAFSVKAGVYVKQGGMNRKQAGEDFYFLQKVFPLGTYSEINTTCVYPSPRPSHRVPFGTGPMINQIIANKGELKTYNFAAFNDVKIHLSNVDSFFSYSDTDIEEYLKKEKNILRSFLVNNNFHSALNEIRSNSSTLKNFRNRYFKWFNAFLILKYLNYSHSTEYNNIDIEEAARLLYKEVYGKDINKPDAKELLFILRDLESN